MGWLKRIFGSSSSSQENSTTVRATSPFDIISRAAEAHQAELQQALTPEARQKAFSLWRRSIDAQAHDYVDLILRHPERDRVVQLEVDTFMRAYLNGYMAGQGWIDFNTALQSAFLLGRAFRDQIRALGIPLDVSVSATFGTVVNETLASIVKLGLDCGKLEKQTDPCEGMNPTGAL
jgi:hypothetical protein